MLGSFMEEMNITPEQFEIACIEGKQNPICINKLKRRRSKEQKPILELN